MSPRKAPGDKKPPEEESGPSEESGPPPEWLEDHALERLRQFERERGLPESDVLPSPEPEEEPAEEAPKLLPPPEDSHDSSDKPAKNPEQRR
jgi:hypothetical protein